VSTYIELTTHLTDEKILVNMDQVLTVLPARSGVGQAYTAMQLTTGHISVKETPKEIAMALAWQAADMAVFVQKQLRGGV
jgi:hypothetical protein